MVFYVALSLIYGIVIQFAHNVVLLSIFTPVFRSMVGATLVTITFIGLVVPYAALATVGASSRSGLAFGNTEWIVKMGLWLGSVVMVMIGFAVFGVPVVNIIFPL